MLLVGKSSYAWIHGPSLLCLEVVVYQAFMPLYEGYERWMDEVVWQRGRGKGETATNELGLLRQGKRGVPQIHGNMPLGNSFPQICVVSVNKSVEISKTAQDYEHLWIKVTYYVDL